MGPTFRILSDEQRSAIASAAFDLLEQVGVNLTEPEARPLLYGAGGASKATGKPVLAMPVTLQALADSREMAAHAVGDDGVPRARPVMIFYSEPVEAI